MSTTTLKLPFKRFVAQVSSAPARSKSSYLALMAENLEALKKCPWREAAVVPVPLTGHDFTASTQFSDAYDAFKLTGNYETANMTEIAYAGMAAYRFKIPASAMTGSVPVASVSLPVSRDRFLKDGLHVAAAISASAEPSADWETIRGSGALAASSVLAQSAATLMDGSADAETVTLDLSGVSSGNPSAYLWVYVTLEDYTDRWTMYNAKGKQLYAVEGSAMLAGDGADVTFDGTVMADDPVFAIAPVRIDFRRYFTGLDGYIFARVHSTGGRVTTENKTPTHSSIAYHDQCDDLSGNGVTPYLQGPVNVLYSLLERGLVYTRAVTEGEMRGASFSLAQDTNNATWSAWTYDLLARSHLVPMRLPDRFPVRRIKLTWAPYYDAGSSVGESTQYSGIPEFRGDPAKTGFINVWLNDGAYVDGFTESLLKNPRIYDARDANAGGFRLLGQIGYNDTTSSKVFTIDLGAPLSGPVASLLFTAYVPLDEMNYKSLFGAMPSGGSKSLVGICPISVESLTDGDPAEFVVNQDDEAKAFNPGVILES